MSEPAANAKGPVTRSPVTIVTQTRVQAGKESEFARWQDEIGRRVAGFPGFIKQTVMPPNPPSQVDWVIQQQFASADAAVAWLHSEERTGLVQQIQPMLAGADDIHIVADQEAGVRPAPISAVVSTRIKPGQEAAYRQWEQKIAAAQSKAPGFQGYRFEPPIPGVQDDWLAILRFDSEAHLQAWLDSPVRQKLLKESESFTQEVHFRIARTGFDQWFPTGGAGGSGPAAWKMNMVVLLLIYPIVFLFGLFVQTPILMGRMQVPFWLALFIGNVVSVLILDRLVPWTSKHLGWWLQPKSSNPKAINMAGAALMVLLYLVSLLIFARL
jgi:antibiotic biosynthesis monooxygenase (ABM) superfamily enzyme